MVNKTGWGRQIYLTINPSQTLTTVPSNFVRVNPSKSSLYVGFVQSQKLEQNPKQTINSKIIKLDVFLKPFAVPFKAFAKG